MQDLYVNHHRWLESWLRLRLGCRQQAADLSQDTFERILSAAGDPAPRQPRAYLATIARRLLIDHWRRRELEQIYLETLASLPEALAPSAEDCAAVLEAIGHLDSALDRLGPAVRRVFLLNQIDGLTYREIAAATGMPVISVRRAMVKAITACCDLA